MYEKYRQLIESVQPQLDELNLHTEEKIAAVKKEADEKIEILETSRKAAIAEFIAKTFGLKIGQIYQTANAQKFKITGLSKTTVYYWNLRKTDSEPKMNQIPPQAREFTTLWMS